MCLYKTAANIDVVLEEEFLSAEPSEKEEKFELTTRLPGDFQGNRERACSPEYITKKISMDQFHCWFQLHPK